MKTHRIFLITGICATGFLCGYAGKRLSGATPATPGAASDGSSPQETRSSASSADHPQDAAKPDLRGAKISKLKSTDTLETLAALDAESLYSRLALWMMDASEQDIAAYWESVRGKKDRPNEITDLIFVNWSRLNPKAAIAAVAGTENEHYAWWAWACHDPQGSLTAALAANPDRVNNVAWGLGEFQAEWLRANFDKIPEAARNNAIRGMTKWDDTDKPLELLEFLKKHNESFNRAIFSTLVRKDPWAAYDWMQENSATITRYYGSKESVMKELVETMAQSQPDALERLADQTPSGELKRRMEAALFENLVQADPDAALEQAMSTKAPVIAAQRLAAVGMSWVSTDPEKAFEIAGNLFKANPDALNGTTTVETPNSTSSWDNSANSSVRDLMGALVTKDPARTMEMQSSDSPTFGVVAQMWASQDLVAYTQWVNQQTDPKIRDGATNAVVNQLLNDEQFPEAAEWMMSSKTARGNLINLMYRWRRTNPDEAREWMDTTDLTESERSDLNRFIKDNP